MKNEKLLRKENEVSKEMEVIEEALLKNVSGGEINMCSTVTDWCQCIDTCSVADPTQPPTITF